MDGIDNQIELCEDNDKINLGSISCTSVCKMKFSKPEEQECEQLVRVKGVCPETVVSEMLALTTDRRWAQLFIPEALCVPEPKPDIEQLLDVTVVSQLISQRVVRTPVLIRKDAYGIETIVPIENAEGLITTGKKLIIEGVLRQKFVYTAAVADQSVHAMHFDVPFSVFIILDKDDPLTRKFKIDMCVEDIFIAGCTARQIFINVTLFVKATPLVCQ
ncbi:MAG: DUF3794 domain-containing protein [Clostridiales bacterium]|nr:DUF3794 domain-containing protein [Clostridiales bacterium]